MGYIGAIVIRYGIDRIQTQQLAVIAELDAFVERRARESKEANALEEAWRESERKHREKQRWN